MHRLLTLTIALAMLAGCGDKASQGAGPVSANADGDARYTEAQVAEMAGLRSDDDGLSWTGPRDCQVSVIMTTRAALKLYADAGDAVVSNPAGDVGVKFSPDPGCREALLKALEAVK